VEAVAAAAELNKAEVAVEEVTLPLRVEATMPLPCTMTK
jgi:hypothetical protein